MSKGNELVVYIGRFSCPHNGHIKTAKLAMSNGRHLLILVGSADEPRTPKNPWTFEERKHMLESALVEYEGQFTIKPLHNFIYNDPKWEMRVQDLVDETCVDLYIKDGGDLNSAKYDPKVSIIGHKKDHTSYYLDLFPQWGFIEVPHVGIMNATDVRNVLFDNAEIHSDVPKPVSDFLKHFMTTPEYQYVKDWDQSDKDYKKQWSGPFPVQFMTTDAIVVQSGHILLVQRKFHPGKDLWALPGGFLDQGETTRQGVLRELREETCIKVPEKVLDARIVKTTLFDDPSRSSRGRTLTHAHLIHLQDVGSLPRIKGADDATKAKWFPLNEFINMRDSLFEDHYHIVRKMLAI